MAVSQLKYILQSVLGAPLGWLGKIFGAVTGLTQFYLAAFLLALGVSLFLMPLRGSGISKGSSDAVKNDKKSGDDGTPSSVSYSDYVQ